MRNENAASFKTENIIIALNVCIPLYIIRYKKTIFYCNFGYQHNTSDIEYLL
jgi:hypothetical protein